VYSLEDITTAIPSSNMEDQSPGIYPNPANDRITVAGWAIEPSATLELIDGQGRCQAQWSTATISNDPDGFVLDLPALSAGAYNLVQRTGSARRSAPVVIER